MKDANIIGSFFHPRPVLQKAINASEELKRMFKGIPRGAAEIEMEMEMEMEMGMGMEISDGDGDGDGYRG